MILCKEEAEEKRIFFSIFAASSHKDFLHIRNFMPLKA